MHELGYMKTLVRHGGSNTKHTCKSKHRKTQKTKLTNIASSKKRKKQYKAGVDKIKQKRKI